MSKAEPPPWISSSAADLIWMEDETTRRREGHETAVAAWRRIFGDETLSEQVADEFFDDGDCSYHRYADGRIYLQAYDADEIRFLKQPTDDPALQGYECCGQEEVGKASCGWHGAVPTANSNCPACLGHAYPRMLLYGRDYPTFRGRLSQQAALIALISGPIPAINDPRCNCAVGTDARWAASAEGGIVRVPRAATLIGHLSTCSVFASPPALPSRATSNLFALIRDALCVYWDGPRPYLRFVPVETKSFRHGLSLNVSLTVDRSQHDAARDEVAAYLTSCFEALTGTNDTKLTFGELAPLERFICWPQPGDNSGHGGYLGSCRIFRKIDDTAARAEHGTTSTLPSTIPVIRIVA